MLTLSIKQPHAHAIIHGLIRPDGSRIWKTVENRTWPTRLRERIAIHACALDPRELRDTLEWWRYEAIAYEIPTGMVYGAVIGTVEIYNCVVDSDSPFFFGPYGFLLRDPRAIEPVTMSGSLGFWEWDGEVVTR